MPLIAAGVIAAAGAIGGSVISSKASKDAAKQQSQSADKALALQTRIYDTGQQQLQPYVGLGPQSTASLGELLQRQRPSFGAPTVPPVQSFAPQQQQGMSLGQMRQVGSGQTPAAAGNPAPGVVRVQAPTGEIAMLSREQAAAAVARGARVMH